MQGFVCPGYLGPFQRIIMSINRIGEYRLKMEHISKTFPGVRALDDVKLFVKPGSVHALIGEKDRKSVV
jgi:ABC-type uncharacterized transport system ATPase subunit